MEVLTEKLRALEELRDSLNEASTIDVPTLKAGCGKIVLKIDMKSYLEAPNIGPLKSTKEFPYPDPWLVGMKSAINAYYGHTNQKLLPACSPPVANNDSNECTIGTAMVRTGYPQEVFAISDLDNEASVITYDGDELIEPIAVSTLFGRLPMSGTRLSQVWLFRSQKVLAVKEVTNWAG